MKMLKPNTMTQRKHNGTVILTVGKIQRVFWFAGGLVACW